MNDPTPAPGEVVRAFEDIPGDGYMTNAEELAWHDRELAHVDDDLSDPTRWARRNSHEMQRDLLVATVNGGHGDGSLVPDLREPVKVAERTRQAARLINDGEDPDRVATAVANLIGQHWPDIALELEEALTAQPTRKHVAALILSAGMRVLLDTAADAESACP